MNLPNTKQIISGKITYTLRDFAHNLRDYTDDLMSKINKPEKRDDTYKTSLVLIILLSEDKPVPTIAKAFNNKEDFIITGQELFKEFVDVARAVQMRLFLNIMETYGTSMLMTLRLLNIEVKKFVYKETDSENDH